MLTAIVSQKAKEKPGHIAVIQGQRRITYGELDARVARMASFLVQNGIQKGDRIGVISKNSPEYIVAYLGIQRAGGIAVDINFEASVNELKTIINQCGIAALIVENNHIDAVSRAVGHAPTVRAIVGMERRARGFSDVRKKIPAHIHYVVLDDITKGAYEANAFPALTGHDIASIVYSSESSREAKGVTLSYDNIRASARSIMEYLRLDAKDKLMVVLPFSYAYGKSLLITHLMAGATLVLENSFLHPDSVLDRMVQEEVTGFAGVPSTFAILLNRSHFRDYRFPNLRYVTQAGGAMPPNHTRELAALLPDARIYIMYGQREATAGLTCLAPDDLLKRPGSIGKAVPGVEVELVREEQGGPAGDFDEGEIVARGKNIMIGYWNNPEDTGKVLKDGRLFTGDIGRMDKDGYLYFVGRKSDRIKIGAHWVSPKEIEDIIHEMSEVHETSVVGIKDGIQGEAIRAVVAVKERYALDREKVLEYCRGKLAPYKIPREVIFVDALPKSASGKIMRSILKSKLAGSPADALSRAVIV